MIGKHYNKFSWDCEKCKKQPPGFLFICMALSAST